MALGISTSSSEATDARTAATDQGVAVGQKGTLNAFGAGSGGALNLIIGSEGTNINSPKARTNVPSLAERVAGQQGRGGSVGGVQATDNSQKVFNVSVATTTNDPATTLAALEANERVVTAANEGFSSALKGVQSAFTESLGKLAEKQSEAVTELALPADERVLKTGGYIIAFVAVAAIIGGVYFFNNKS